MMPVKEITLTRREGPAGPPPPAGATAGIYRFARCTRYPHFRPFLVYRGKICPIARNNHFLQHRRCTGAGRINCRYDNRSSSHDMPFVCTHSSNIFCRYGRRQNIFHRQHTVSSLLSPAARIYVRYMRR